MATETGFVEVQATPLRAGDPAYLGPFRLKGRLSHRPYATSYLGVDALRRMAVLTAFRQGGRVEIPRQVLDDSLAAVRRVVGPTVATVLDSGWQDQIPWIALRYVPGETAAEQFANHGPLDEQQLMPFAAALASGLKLLHAAGVVHGDLGPHNVTLTPRGPVIIGFGGPPGPKGHRIGPWIAPEWSRTAPAAAGDVYAWGWLVAAATLGPDALKFKELRRGARLLSTDLSMLPGPLPHMVGAALEAHPADRPSAENLAAALPLRQWPPRRVPPVMLAPAGYRPPGQRKQAKAKSGGGNSPPAKAAADKPVIGKLPAPRVVPAPAARKRWGPRVMVAVTIAASVAAVLLRR